MNCVGGLDRTVDKFARMIRLASVRMNMENYGQWVRPKDVHMKKRSKENDETVLTMSRDCMGKR